MASMNNPGLIGIEWHTSGDACPICEDLVGVYKPENLPTTPHPQCQCYTTDKAISSQQFVTDYIEWMRDKSSHPELTKWHETYWRKAA